MEHPKVKKQICGWGRYPSAYCYLQRPERYEELVLKEETAIPRGLGRSYGDAALNTDGIVVLMERMNRFLSFDPVGGIVRAEAGITLKDILAVFIPKGWFLPVTPGTKFATLGGCAAADVHGKNHHADGTFGRYIRAMELILPDGSKRRCSPKQDSALFWATIGGMGLTGIISELTLQLIPIESSYILAGRQAAPNLNKAMELLSEENEKYSAAWIDCLAKGAKLGRSIVMRGRHASLGELPSSIEEPLKVCGGKEFSMPFDCPSWLLSKGTVRIFNQLYYWAQGRSDKLFIMEYGRFFYPLDSIAHWNRLYGTRGFIQYQFVAPLDRAEQCIRTILQKLADTGCGSFLAVLKKFGKEGNGMLSFPTEGFTLALDIPMRDSKILLPLLNELDRDVLHFGGRGYLAKDCRMSPETFRKMYPRFKNWLAVKRLIDPKGWIGSDLSRRLCLVEE